ncbi:MAG: hypothetical protein P4M00_03165 [Azospirillaceae bacterium]|nr:hypothetical protein [Azospirillaceae bacterium]
MRKAIEEGFILDVLKNDTPYKLANGGEEWDDRDCGKFCSGRRSFTRPCGRRGRRCCHEPSATAGGGIKKA